VFTSFSKCAKNISFISKSSKSFPTDNRAIQEGRQHLIVLNILELPISINPILVKEYINNKKKCKPGVIKLRKPNS
jgi:hypothetical protein